MFWPYKNVSLLNLVFYSILHLLCELNLKCPCESAVLLNSHIMESRGKGKKPHVQVVHQDMP